MLDGWPIPPMPHEPGSGFGPPRPPAPAPARRARAPSPPGRRRRVLLANLVLCAGWLPLLAFPERGEALWISGTAAGSAATIALFPVNRAPGRADVGPGRTSRGSSAPVASPAPRAARAGTGFRRRGRVQAVWRAEPRSGE